MTKKDYILIGNALRKSRSNLRPIGGVWTQASLESWYLTVDEIAIALKSENSLFDYSRFLKYVKEG
jgi:hypothetical protein